MKIEYTFNHLVLLLTILCVHQKFVFEELCHNNKSMDVYIVT